MVIKKKIFPRFISIYSWVKTNPPWWPHPNPRGYDSNKFEFHYLRMNLYKFLPSCQIVFEKNSLNDFSFFFFYVKIWHPVFCPTLLPGNINLKNELTPPEYASTKVKDFLAKWFLRRRVLKIFLYLIPM